MQERKRGDERNEREGTGRIKMAENPEGVLNGKGKWKNKKERKKSGRKRDSKDVERRKTTKRAE